MWLNTRFFFVVFVDFSLLYLLFSTQQVQSYKVMSVLCCMELWVITAFHFVECASHLYSDDIFKFLQGNSFLKCCSLQRLQDYKS